MKELSKEVYPTIDSIHNLFMKEPFGFKEKIKWNGEEYLIFVREDKEGDLGTEIVFRKLITL
jgi:hypothetical protein